MHNYSGNVQVYDISFLRCPCAQVAFDAWYERLTCLLRNMESATEFRVYDNGYGTYPSVLVQGVKATFRGHSFTVCSDLPGEIILRHESVPRSEVEPLCRKINEYWVIIPEDTA